MATVERLCGRNHDNIGQRFCKIDLRCLTSNRLVDRHAERFARRPCTRVIKNLIVPTATDNRVIAETTLNRVIACATKDEVISFRPNNDVTSVSTRNRCRRKVRKLKGRYDTFEIDHVVATPPRYINLLNI